MAKKRLHILFHGNSLCIDGEETELKAVIQMYTVGKQTGFDAKSLIWSDTYSISLMHVIGMLISDIPPDVAAEQIKLLKRQNAENEEPWRRSIRPDPDEDN